jgi:hypothetical protein
MASCVNQFTPDQKSRVGNAAADSTSLQRVAGGQPGSTSRFWLPLGGAYLMSLDVTSAAVPNSSRSRRCFIRLLVQPAAAHQAPCDVGGLEGAALGRRMGGEVARNRNQDMAACSVAPHSSY